MTDAKHTPGPWEISTDANGYEVCTVHGIERMPTEDGFGQEWCYIKGPRLIGGEWFWPTRSHQTAAAHLIAAAPDMYEALISARKEIVNSFRAVVPDMPEDCMFPISEIDAALAKAKGEPK